MFDDGGEVGVNYCGVVVVYYFYEWVDGGGR